MHDIEFKAKLAHEISRRIITLGQDANMAGNEASKEIASDGLRRFCDARLVLNGFIADEVVRAIVKKDKDAVDNILRSLPDVSEDGEEKV